MSRATFFFQAAQLNILVLCGVLLGGFAFLVLGPLGLLRTA